MSDRSETAMIVVHGVADQAPGVTLDAVVDLLVSARLDGNVRYAHVDARELTLPVEPLRPESIRARLAKPAMQDKPAANQPARVMQALRHSGGADLELAQNEVHDTADDEAPGPGDEITAALLTQSEDGGEVYKTRSVTLERRDEKGAATSRIDVYEMYWADLSRLSSAVPRVVSEVFTLIFRLSRLGHDTVHAAAKGHAGAARLAWRTLAWFQAALDWTLVHILSMQFFALGLLGLSIVAMGGARALSTSHQALLLHVLVGTVSATLLLAGLYALNARDPSRRGWACLAVGLALLAGWWYAREALTGPSAAWLQFGIVIAVALALHWLVLTMGTKRFPISRLASSVPVAVAFAAAVGCAIWPPAWLATADAFVRALGSLTFGVEVLLLTIKFTWAAVGFAIAAWLLLGLGLQFAVRRDHSLAGSIATGRLGFGISTLSFLMLAFLIWAALSRAFALAAAGVPYTSFHFPDFEEANCFLADRFHATTMSFAPLSLLLLVLAAYGLAMFLPSLVAEAGVRFGRHKHTWGDAFTSGRWLTRCYRHFDLVVAVLLSAAAVTGVLVALAHFGAYELPDQALERLQGMSIGPLSRVALVAGSAVGVLVLFGGVLSRFAPALRGPLDVALDVDNHFRAFPVGAVPRARIFSRYEALLKEIVRQDKYARLVIVAHSQGTVITAEYLRFRKVEKRAPGFPVHLVTFGSPLRQLYANRFPVWYGWALERHVVHGQHVSGPDPDRMGLSQWLNGFCSGDYVGRWLWASADKALSAPLVGSPMNDVGLPPAKSVYDALPALGPGGAPWGDYCLGYGAHTHYFDIGQDGSARLIDAALR